MGLKLKNGKTNNTDRAPAQIHHKDNTRVVPFEEPNITKEKLKALLPKRTSIAITDEILRLINNIEEDTGLSQEMVEEDIMSYMHLLGGNSFGMKDYVNAVKFCNLQRNYDNKQAWSIVFPERYDKLRAANKPVDNHVSMYSNGKLVTAINKELLIPVHIQYAGYFHAAVKKQFELMSGKSSQGDGKVTPMVEHLAAKELALLTAQPVDTKIDIKLSPGDAAIDMYGEMSAQIAQLVKLQKTKADAGEDITDVQVVGLDFSNIGRDSE